MTESFLSAPRIDLQGVRLVGLEPAVAPQLAAAIVAMPPWSAMDYPADAMARFLAMAGDGASRYLIEVDGAEAGAVAVRHPWLKGPYLELLALLPPFQHRGIGAGIMSWFEQAGRGLGARNLWVCASSFNDGALRFYQRHGFRPAATLPGLVAESYDEILLRKFPLPGAR
jgi:GNAT superfamily N-acetyltransferase